MSFPEASDLDADRIPRHVACVMDGNGRWAKSQGLKRTEGHEAGEQSLFDVVEGAIELGIGYLTVYAFSTENWRRPLEEVKFLLGFNEKLLVARRDDLHQRNVRVRFIGRRERRVPGRVMKRIDEAVELTAANTGLTLTIAFNYGGRAEIVDAVRALVASGADAKSIDEEAIAENLYDPSLPDPDLVIRTSGEYRISNFLLWQMAYSELVFTDVLWPDFRRGHLRAAIAEYQNRDRRYGGVDET